MSGILDFPVADTSQWVLGAKVFVRQEPDDDEDENGDDGDSEESDDDDDNEADEGYSE